MDLGEIRLIWSLTRTRERLGFANPSGGGKLQMMAWKLDDRAWEPDGPVRVVKGRQCHCVHSKVDRIDPPLFTMHAKEAYYTFSRCVFSRQPHVQRRTILSTGVRRLYHGPPSGVPWSGVNRPWSWQHMKWQARKVNSQRPDMICFSGMVIEEAKKIQEPVTLVRAPCRTPWFSAAGHQVSTSYRLVAHPIAMQHIPGT